MPVTRTVAQERKLIALLNEAGPLLREAVNSIQMYAEHSAADLTEIELHTTMWSCDDKLVFIYDVQLSDEKADAKNALLLEEMLDYMTPSNIIYSI
jgi:hypothetical protein